MRTDIKTLDDALRVNCVTVEQYRQQTQGLPDDIRAFIALRYIVAALNDGWRPTFGSMEIRHYVWYDVLPDLEYDRTPSIRKYWPINCRVGHNGNYHLAIVRVRQDRTPFDEGKGLMMGEYPAALAFRDKETAYYAGHQFAEAFLTLYFSPQRDGSTPLATQTALQKDL